MQAVIHPDDRGPYECGGRRPAAASPPVLGGATRQASVRAGLEALAPRSPDIVLVHDAARPFCSAALVSRAIKAARCETGAAIPALDVTDTIKSVDAAGAVTGTLDRATLRAVQTPQAFAFSTLLDAHRRAASRGPARFHRRCRAGGMGGPQGRDRLPGELGNVKLTTDEDFARAEARRIASLADLRTGNGFDVHAVRPTAIMSGSAACASRTTAGSPVIPTPTSRCTRWSTPSSARSPTATSASIFRPAIRDGAAPRPISS